MAVSTEVSRSSNSFFSPARLAKPVLFIVCLFPLFSAMYGVAYNKLGANPVESILHLSGEWGLRFLLITLCVTPIQVIFKWVAVARVRRMLGLYAFFYTTLHLIIWVVLDQGLDVNGALKEIVEKKFITFGIIVWIGLLCLASTSNRWAVKKLGRNWKKLHNWVYVLTLFSVVHFIWQVKSSEWLEPSVYLGALTTLLLWRFYRLAARS